MCRSKLQSRRPILHGSLRPMEKRAKIGVKFMKSVKEKWRTSTHSQHGKHQSVPSQALSVLRLVPQHAKIEPLVVKIAAIFLLNTTKVQQMCRKHIYSREKKSEPGFSNAALTEEFSIFFFFGLSRKNIEFSAPLYQYSE